WCWWVGSPRSLSAELSHKKAQKAQKFFVKLLDQLDELKNQFTPDTADRVERLLEQLSRQKLNDTDSLVRYHEILLFLRAYPQNATIVRAVEKELRSFSARVSALDVDVSPLAHPAVSGIAGTS